MKLNKKYFENKTWKEILTAINFDKHLCKLSKKLKNKTVILYGAGTMLDYIIKNYDFSNFNILAVSDKKFKNSNEIYENYPTISPYEINSDAIIICTQYPYGIYKFLKKEIFKNKKSPKVYFLLNKPIYLYAEEIFSN